MLRISISGLCDDLKPTIIDALAARFVVDLTQDNIMLPEEYDVPKVKKVLEETLSKKSDYVVTENMVEEGEIAILKKGDMEQLGIFFCSFCAMVFGNETEKNIHQRVHFFGFG